MRSGIGGPAVGKHLRLHPAGIVNGIYAEPIEAWVGQIQSEVSDHFARCEGDHGFLIESVGATPSLHAAGIPWKDGEQHKRDFARMFRHHAPFLSVARDHGEGESVADGRGQPHDAPGVWIGDASAFPTAPGVNPMVSIMAVAHRTAQNMLA